MTKQLTRDELYGYRIIVKKDETREWGYQILRESRINKSTTPVLHELRVHLNETKHKYGQNKSYYIVSFSSFGKQVTIPLHRLVYTYFVGDIAEGYDVDHIDGNSLNNDVDNLQLLTREQNLAKRSGAKNQWSYKKSGNKYIELFNSLVSDDLKLGKSDKNA